MSHNILRLPAVIHRTGISRSTIYLMMSKGEFPEAISLGERAVGWVESQIDQWLDEKITASQESK
jgi:prophage regulatory protein